MIKLMSIIDGFMAEKYANELKESCRKLLLLTEAKTGFTESVHEVFVALALAGCKNPQNFKRRSNEKNRVGGLEYFTDSDIKKWVGEHHSGITLYNEKKHIDELIKMRPKTEWSATDKDKHIDKGGKKVKVTRSLNLWIEASKIASRIKKLYLSNEYTMTGVSRVFGAGPKGKKMVADIIIYEKKGTEKLQLAVSLKAGKHAQFTNLSVKNILNYLFPDTPDVEKGILNICYRNGFKDELDQGYQAYLGFVLKEYHDNRDIVLGIKDSDIDKHNEQMKAGVKKEKTFKWNKNRPKLVYPQGKMKKVSYAEAELLDEIAFTKRGGTRATSKTWVSKQAWSNSSGTNYMIGLSSELKKALEHAFGSSPLTTSKKSGYEPFKKKLVNTTIKKYLKDLDWNKTDLHGLFTYVLRAQPKTSYLYAGSSGNKLSFMPSEEVIKTHKFTVKTIDVDSADFIMLIEVSIGTDILFTFDLKWRWGQGQWRGDLSQKGAVFDVTSKFWSTFTGVPKGRWPGT
jgi:hypothetical protein